MPSDNDERRTLIAILGYAGIVADTSRPDFRRALVPDAERPQTHWGQDGWLHPVQWWNSFCGVNETAIEEQFLGLTKGG